MACVHTRYGSHAKNITKLPNCSVEMRTFHTEAASIFNYTKIAGNLVRVFVFLKKYKNPDCKTAKKKQQRNLIGMFSVRSERMTLTSFV